MLTCAYCTEKGCYKKNLEKVPKNCPTVNKKDEIDEIDFEYLEEENLKIAQISAEIAISDYGKKSRLKETIEFCQKMGYKKIGLVFCYNVRDEAFVLARVLKDFGFEVESVICKVGSIDRGFIDVDNEDKPPMCNPLAQEVLLGEENVDFNIVFGLCVGHDTLFLQNTKKPATVLAVKDRLYNHEPMEAIEEAKELLKQNKSLKLLR